MHNKSIIQVPFQNATAFNQRYKIVFYLKAVNEAYLKANAEKPELAPYDTESDYAETSELSVSKPEVLSELRLSYEGWFKK